MKLEQKITIEVSGDLLAKAQNATGADIINETVRKGLELVAANDAYERLLRLRGKVRLSLDLNKLREDR